MAFNAGGATITVTTTADDLTPNDGSVSLREAITAINSGNDLGDPDITAQNPGTFGTNDRINFNIAGAGVHTITPATVLPAIAKSVVIDGYAQPGSSVNTLANGDNATIQIQINGATVEPPAGTVAGLTIAASNCTVRGLAINTFFQQITISLGSGNVIIGNFLGTDASGTTVPGTGNQGSIGVQDNSPNNTIGGTTADARNVIGVRGNGIEISGPGGGATGTLVQGNFIGTDHTGATGFGIGNAGVHVNGVSSVTIGGTVTGARNIISGGNGDGISLLGNNCIVQGNFLGTDVTGTKAVGNNQGIAVGGSNNLVGGATASARNVISGNRNRGLGLESASSSFVQGNYIGVDVSGTMALGNGNDGMDIFVGSPQNNLIGGVTATPGVPPGNIISGNTNAGIVLNGTNNNTIQGNIIGADVTGTVALGNTGDGITILNSIGNLVGGTTAGTANIIAFNGGNGPQSGFAGEGVHVVDPPSINNSILGNSIFSNDGLGIELSNNLAVPNDPGDTDDGPNHLQNFPVLSSVQVNGGSTTIMGTLNSHASTVYRLEFFSNQMVDPSGFGEGQTFLGSADVMTDGSGNAAFNVVVPQVATGVTATATDPNGNTSEFSGASAAAAVGQLTNISTRLEDFTGDTVLIAGFVINGVDDKTVVIRARGPSLANPPFNLAGVLPDTTVALFSGGTMIASNDNWQDTQAAEIMATGLQPPDPHESAIIMKLHPGSYTAIVRGVGNAMGITIGEVFDVDLAANSRLANISTRGFVGTGDNVMIGGFVVGGGSERVLARAKGPSLAQQGVPNVVPDTMLRVFDGNGAKIGSNDNWKDMQQADIQATGLAPTNDLESAIILDLAAGSYTGIVTGVNNATGNGQIEVFDLP